MEGKKGELGLETVKGVMIVFLVIAIIGVTLIVLGTNLSNVSDDIDVTSVSVINLTTLSVVNETGAYLSGTSTLRNCALTITQANNVSDYIAPGNYTTSGCLVVYDGNAWANNSNWNITGSYSYSEDNAFNIHRNISGGVVGFFSNTATIFAILVVVVIILAISIIIFAVSRFGGRDAGI